MCLHALAANNNYSNEVKQGILLCTTHVVIFVIESQKNGSKSHIFISLYLLQ